MSDPRDTNDFLPEIPYSLRPVCQEWLNRRAAELAVDGQPNVEGALMEVIERLLARTSHNYDHEAQTLVYTPTNDTDPYVVVLPLVYHNRATRPKLDPPKTLTLPNPDNRRSNIRDDFENLIFEEYVEFTPGDLEQDLKGGYKNPKVNTLWEGFRMYHNKLTIEAKPVFRQNYHKALGRYVLARVGNNGVPIFTKAPFRHTTRATAIQEATRLAAEVGEAFGIFRCLDIVGKPPKDHA